MTSSSFSNAVFIGPSNAGKKTLVQSLLKLYHLNNGKSDSQPHFLEVSSPNGFVLQQEVQFSNKYLTSRVLLNILPSTEFALPSEHTIDLIGNSDSVVVVLDGTSPVNFSSLDSLAGVVTDLGVSTLVVCLNKSDIWFSESDNVECSAESSVHEWCINNGFEYLETNSLDYTSGRLDREKEGIPRVLEALETTMWKSGVVPSSLTEASKVNLEESEGPMAASSKSDSASADNEDAVDFDDDVLVKMMEEMRRVKEHARSENVSDAERRERAAEMAMKFMALAGFRDD